MDEPVLRIEGLAKAFTLHVQGGARIPVLRDLALEVRAGECVGLAGPSGVGKSTLLRMVYGNYTCPEGRILVRHDGDCVDVAGASPQAVLALRRMTIGYVSQFLRVIPRVPTLDIVAEPLRARGIAAEAARERAGALLRRLQVPQALWGLSPLTFSGGEKQRVNIARVFVADYPLLLLDEPTASLDAANRDIVVDLIAAARDRGAAMLGIFHDATLRARLCNRVVDMQPCGAAA
jgi:alpha-D-ribose 1-methylphosphonate 5-triphosphate synthase subunit PhnL